LLLDRRNAVIYGGGGAIGSAVARAFAREGATVHLAGRTRATLDAAADAIGGVGGHAEVTPPCSPRRTGAAR
jgi:NAD(P)-dependent dehydrogenase (short-subunit alcohol dehydrogenase family)